MFVSWLRAGDIIFDMRCQVCEKPCVCVFCSPQGVKVLKHLAEAVWSRRLMSRDRCTGTHTRKHTLNVCMLHSDSFTLYLHKYGTLIPIMRTDLVVFSAFISHIWTKNVKVFAFLDLT